MQSMIHQLIKLVFQILETITPTLAGKLAIFLFFRPMQHNRPQREKPLIQNAIIQKIPLQDIYDKSIAEPHYVMYSWGEGPPILLVHGWAGRGSQVAFFTQPLVNAGYKVVTFDALAHGDSPGSRTNLLEFAQIIKQIETNVGEFQAIIGHSFGGIAAALAISDGVKAAKLITISSPVSMTLIFEEFAKQLNVSNKTTEKIARYIEQLTHRKIDDFSLFNLVDKLNQPGLIVHDEHDKEINYSQALTLAKYWPKGKLISTQNLGHYRILRDSATISKIVNFIVTGQLQENVQVTGIKAEKDKRPVQFPLDQPLNSGII